jgi:Zn-dependent protease
VCGVEPARFEREVAGVGTQVVRAVNGRPARGVEGHAKVIGRKDRAVVAARPMEVDRADDALRQVRTPLREPHARAANTRIVHETPTAPPPVYEGEYLPPPAKPPESRWKGIGAGAVGFGLLLAKFKTAFLVLLNLKWFLVGSKLLLSSFSFFASVWLYAMFWGWPFAFVFTLLILVHELGHVLFMKIYGVPASLPFFIPGLGAFVKYDGGARPNPQQEAYIALGGPLCGTLGALACFAYGQATASNFWIAAAYTGFFLNLINLIPVLPFDGGRVAGAVSPRVSLVQSSDSDPRRLQFAAGVGRLAHPERHARIRAVATATRRHRSVVFRAGRLPVRRVACIARR